MWFLRPLRFLAKALAGQETPRQLAAGFALGLILGLIPKGNLTAQLLLIAFCATQANFASMLLSAFVFSWLAVLIDPLSHRVGLALLEAGPLVPLWTKLYNMPVVPWTAFNNTLVLGGLVVGAALAYPAYLASLPAFARWQPALAERLRKFKLVQLLLGAELGERFR